MSAVFLLIGLVVGAGAVWLAARAKIDAAKEALERSEEVQLQWEDRFKAATGDALLKSQSSLLELTEAKLAPIRDTLTRFEEQARRLEERRLQSVSAVGEQL